MELYSTSQKMLIQHKFLIGLGIKQNIQRQICEARSDNDTPAGPPSAEKMTDKADLRDHPLKKPNPATPKSINTGLFLTVRA